MTQAVLKGTRLEFVVVPLEGEVQRVKRIMTPVPNGKNADGTKRFVHKMEPKLVTEPAGYMVYFPRGHALRMTAKELRRHGLNREPEMINLQGLNDPNSPLGQLLTKQDKDSRVKAYSQLERQVIQLVQNSAVGGGTQLTLVEDVVTFEDDNAPIIHDEKASNKEAA